MGRSCPGSGRAVFRCTRQCRHALVHTHTHTHTVDLSCRAAQIHRTHSSRSSYAGRANPHRPTPSPTRAPSNRGPTSPRPAGTRSAGTRAICRTAPATAAAQQRDVLSMHTAHNTATRQPLNRHRCAHAGQPGKAGRQARAAARGGGGGGDTVTHSRGPAHTNQARHCGRRAPRIIKALVHGATTGADRGRRAPCAARDRHRNFR